MDLSELSQAMETEVELIHPVTNKPTGIKVILRSRHSAEMKALARQVADSRLALARRNKSMDSAAIEDEVTGFMVASVRSWSGITKGGTPLECTPENVKGILIDPGLQWIKKQLDEALGNDALFFPG